MLTQAHKKPTKTANLKIKMDHFRGCRSNKAQCGNQGSPARIPEISKSSHYGIKFHPDTLKQTPTTPGHNKVVKNDVLKVSCCGVASWALRNLATSVSMIWICFKVMQLESHACTGKIHAGGSACTSPPVRLDHLFFTGRFCL